MWKPPKKIQSVSFFLPFCISDINSNDCLNDVKYDCQVRDEPTDYIKVKLLFEVFALIQWGLALIIYTGTLNHVCERVLVMQPHLSLSQLPLFLCDVMLRKQICTFLPLVRRVVFVPQDHCVSAQEVGTAWTHMHTFHLTQCTGREQCTDRFRKTSLVLFIMISRTLTLHNLSENVQRSNTCIWNRCCASSCILMGCQWFCDVSWRCISPAEEVLEGSPYRKACSTDLHRLQHSRVT